MLIGSVLQTPLNTHIFTHKKYLANYQNYVSYLEKVVQLPVEDLDKELFKAKIQQQSKNMSDEEKQLMIQTLQG